MNGSGFASFAAALLLIASSLQAAPAVGSQAAVIPSTTCGDYFLIPIEVDLDRDGQSTTLMALFDTGGNGLHIDPDAVVRAGGNPVEERRQITIRNASAGPLKIRKLRPYTRHLDHLSRALGTKVDIFLPFRTFRNYLLTLDFPRREIRIARGRLPRPDGKTIFDARGPDRRPWLKVDISGSEFRLLVDSGSSGSISIRGARELSWLSPLVPASVAQGMEGLRYSNIGRLDASLEIAGIEIREPLVEVDDDTELIGTDIMRRFAWTFDQRSRRMRIEPASMDPLRLPPKRGTGAIVVPHADGYEINRVLPDTPAEREGLRPGDVLTALDGVRIYDRGCSKWDEKHRDKSMLTLRRGGETFDLSVEVVDLVP